MRAPAAGCLVIACLLSAGCCFDAVSEVPLSISDAGPDAGAPDASLIIAPIGSDGGAPPIACTAYVPPALPDACAAPSVVAGGVVVPPTAQPISSWALATDGDGEASFAFVLGVTTSSLPWRVYLQRLSPEGVLLGPLNEIDLPEWGPLVALAASPVSHVLCWENSSSTISCAAMPVGGGPVYPGVTVSGQLPALAYGPAGFLLAYEADDGTVTLQPLDCSARAAGAPASIAGLSADALGLTASAEGYALVTGSPNGAFAQFISTTGAPQRLPVAIDGNFSSGDFLELSGGTLSVSGGFYTASGPVQVTVSCGLVVPSSGGTFAGFCTDAGADLFAPVSDGVLLFDFSDGGLSFLHLGCP
ncbi:MAG: hypothetical protein ACYDCL_19585 [Myxococcales bacterium]